MRVDELISIIDKIRGVKVCLLVIGKTDAEFVRAGIAEYEKRLKYYIPYEMKVLPDVRNTKNMSEVQQKEREGELLLGQLETADYVILLDEKGNEYTSRFFADFLAQKMLTSMKRLANMKISLSKMTFSHQMVRMIFTEQLYRAMTILKGEPYHHE